MTTVCSCKRRDCLSCQWVAVETRAAASERVRVVEWLRREGLRTEDTARARIVFELADLFEAGQHDLRQSAPGVPISPTVVRDHDET